MDIGCTTPSLVVAVGSLIPNEHHDAPSVIRADHAAPTAPVIWIAAEPSVALTEEEALHVAVPDEASGVSSPHDAATAATNRNAYHQICLQYLIIAVICKNRQKFVL